MKIGVISDTHLPGLGPLPPHIIRAFAGVELILHAGDIYNVPCLDWLEQIAPVVAVEVPPAPAMGDPRVTEKRVIELEGYTIGMMHDLAIGGMGWEVTPGIIAAKFPADLSLSDALAQTFGRPIDIAVFGHTHAALIEEHQGILFINPGSPTLPNQVRRLGQVAILDLTPDERSARLLDLKDFAE